MNSLDSKIEIFIDSYKSDKNQSTIEFWFKL